MEEVGITIPLPIYSAPMPVAPAISALFEAGAHMGHSKSRRHPKMAPFIFGTRNNIEIFDLEQTETRIQKAEEFLRELGKNAKLVLWVGSKPAARKHVERVAAGLGMPMVVERWLGGLLTNFKVLEGRLRYWQALETEVAHGGLEKYVKKERLLKLVELRKLTRMFGGLRPLTRIPDAIVVVDPAEEFTASKEAFSKHVPLIALLNSDCNPEGILYPIPANDDATKTIELIVERLGKAYQEGKASVPVAATV